MTLRDIDRGPGVARAAAKTATAAESGGSDGSSNGSTARSVEWSLEVDAAVRFHAQAALLRVDDSVTGITSLYRNT